MSVSRRDCLAIADVSKISRSRLLRSKPGTFVRHSMSLMSLIEQRGKCVYLADVRSRDTRVFSASSRILCRDETREGLASFQVFRNGKPAATITRANAFKFPWTTNYFKGSSSDSLVFLHSHMECLTFRYSARGSVSFPMGFLASSSSSSSSSPGKGRVAPSSFLLFA